MITELTPNPSLQTLRKPRDGGCLGNGAGDDALGLGGAAALHRVRLPGARLPIAEQAHLRFPHNKCHPISHFTLSWSLIHRVDIKRESSEMCVLQPTWAESISLKAAT